MKTPSFSHIVCGDEPLQSAFGSSSFVVCLWWRAILWLHGKPRAPQLSDEAKRTIIADGFRFYARLYRFLAVLLWFVSASVWFAGVFDSARDALFWMGAGVLNGFYLWLASGVGFAGAKMLRQREPNARLLLTAFMVFIIGWLSAFLAVLSIEAQSHGVGDVWLNLGVTGVVWAFGIGSYLIEVLYLVADTRLTCE